MAARVLRVDRDIFRPGPRADIRILVARRGSVVKITRLEELGLLDQEGNLRHDQLDEGGVLLVDPAAPTAASAAPPFSGVSKAIPPKGSTPTSGVLTPIGGGWYQLPNGERVRGIAGAQEALAALNGGAE